MKVSAVEGSATSVNLDRVPSRPSCIEGFAVAGNSDLGRNKYTEIAYCLNTNNGVKCK